MNIKNPIGLNYRKTIINRITKYSQGSRKLTILSGICGTTTICSANIVSLNLDGPNVGETLIAYGGGTAGDSTVYQLDASTTDTSDSLTFFGQNLGMDPTLQILPNASGSLVMVDTGTSYLAYLAIGSTVDATLTTAGLATVSMNINFNSWTTDRNGAFGFKTGDNQFGFINISWEAIAKTMTILGGKYESTPNTSITVTAVPEPSQYAAALGLGALGLSFYRRRSGNIARKK